MPNRNFRALLVDGNAADRGRVSTAVAAVSGVSELIGSFSADTVCTFEQALNALARGEHDVLLLDPCAPDGGGLDALRAARSASPDVAVVILTAAADVDLAREALSLGAQDFLCKDDLRPELVARTLRSAVEQRRGARALAVAAREKAVLLRALHHRAKNNLQIISSLLGMQARRTNDAGFRALVDAAQARVEAIALAQDELHRAPHLGCIDISAYLARLARAAHRAHDGERRGITLALDLGELELPLEQAVAMGLLVNELLTNALKHAYVGDSGGTLRLSLGQSGGNFRLVVADDGVGFGDPTSTGSRPLGLELVASLAEQLDASLEHVTGTGAGTAFHVVFPIREASV